MPSCSSAAQDYAVYEGQVGSWYSHTAIDCSDDGLDRVEEITPAPGNRYYLVVPLSSPAEEGPYGTSSTGAARPAGTTTCAPTQDPAACP